MDTARHFLSLAVLERLLDGSGANTWDKIYDVEPLAGIDDPCASTLRFQL